MIAWIFVAAIAVAAAVMMERRWQKRRSRRLWAEQPAGSPGTALVVRRFDSIDATVRARRCSCGGLLQVISEGSRSIGAQVVRVVHVECSRCEEPYDLFFDVSEVMH